MQYEEERSARALYAALMDAFAEHPLPIDIRVEGRGVHWTVTVTRADRTCRISCFGPSNFYIAFAIEAVQATMGRTTVHHELLAAISLWVDRRTVRELYEQFAFVDKTQRAIEALRSDIIQRVPQLIPYVTIQEDWYGSEFSAVQFTAHDRQCRIFFYGNDEVPFTSFLWDECELFKVQTAHVDQLALALTLWIHDQVMPSELEQACSWISVGKLAQFYEQGRGIEGEFVVSWDRIEEFYERLSFPFVPAVRAFVTDLRQRGYDHELRAGQSLWVLIVSRSRRHGLRHDQAHISFNFHRDGMTIAGVINDPVERVVLSTIAWTLDIDHLLQQLAAQPID